MVLPMPMAPVGCSRGGAPLAGWKIYEGGGVRVRNWSFADTAAATDEVGLEEVGGCEAVLEDCARDSGIWAGD